ncbi:tyrosine-type recombinase/integrase [Microbacterium marinilacus]|uniref:Tyr recombinase domain-containing protein n=1 Tax=Microbacterium marinilacus TaxID=415209 RepID=A0ABP7BJQ6_9MICO|nr:tyrosine-type recombinase/integrase [Microbacterium marinilacus]MBY0688342.1 tyrosine-type recombinase/integrase [Microbacterium marinilacus]
MTVHDTWKGLTKNEIEQRRAKGGLRYQRRWREGRGREAVQRKQSYSEAQRVQAYVDDAKQMGHSGKTIKYGPITVNYLLDRHLAARANRSPNTVRDYHYRSQEIRRRFGDRVVTSLDTTEIEIWSARAEVAAQSRKKTLELLRASIRRGIRDGVVDADPTEGIVVSLGHKERPHWSHAELIAVLSVAPTSFDRALLGVQGLMGLRLGEARSLTVGSIVGDTLKVRNSGAGADTTKTRASMRTLPIPGSLRPLLTDIAGDRSRDSWLFASPRRRGQPISARYTGTALERARTIANQGRKNEIPEITAHGLRHTFAAITLSELGADILSVSRALGHSRPSTTLNHYGHLAPAGLETLMERLDAFDPRPR